MLQVFSGLHVRVCVCVCVCVCEMAWFLSTGDANDDCRRDKRDRGRRRGGGGIEEGS